MLALCREEKKKTFNESLLVALGVIVFLALVSGELFLDIWRDKKVHCNGHAKWKARASNKSELHNGPFPHCLVSYHNPLINAVFME